MDLKIKAFGISKEIVGGKEIVFKVNGQTVADLRRALNEKFPALLNLNSLFIAVNNSYSEEEVLLKESDEIALIPPVSGG
jgi:molybdopterin converting factor subunit 1